MSETKFKSRLMGGCDGLLLVLVGALQIGLLIGFTAVSAARSEAVDSAQAPVARQAYVEVVVVEATKISRG
jgi:hypothetical protein